MRIFIFVLIALLFSGCASTSLYRVVLTESGSKGDIVTVAKVQSNGTFHTVLQSKESKRILTGELSDAENGQLDLKIQYNHSSQGGRSVQTNTQIRVYPNAEVPLGGLIKDTNTLTLTVKVIKK